MNCKWGQKMVYLHLRGKSVETPWNKTEFTSVCPKSSKTMNSQKHVVCDSAYCSLETHTPLTPEFICKPNKTGKIYDTAIMVYEESSTESPNNE